MRRSSRCATSASHSRPSASGKVEFAPSRLVQQDVEAVTHRRQLQPPQHLGQGRCRGAAHHPPPATCSYSANGRRRSAAGSIIASTTPSDRGSPLAPTTMPRRWARSHGALAPTPPLPVARHLRARVADPHLAVVDHDADLRADQLPGHAVVVGVDVHAAVVLHAAGQLAHLPERWPAAEWPQRLALLTLEPHHRYLARGAVHALVGDLAHPPRQVRLQRRPAGEAPARDGVALDVADAALVLALGTGPVRRTSHGPHDPSTAQRRAGGR